MGGGPRLRTGMRGLPDDLRDDARAWAVQTAQDQGLGPKVSGEVLASVALLFETSSGPPDGRKPGVVKPVQSGSAGGATYAGSVFNGLDQLTLSGFGPWPGIAAGQTITGPGVQAGTTVSSQATRSRTCA